MWVGTDLTESAAVNEAAFAARLIADLSAVTAGIAIKEEDKTQIGFLREKTLEEHHLKYETLISIFNSTPGLNSDKLKNVLEITWSLLKPRDKRGIIFAYDEAQTLVNSPKKEQFPLTLLLDVFQSIQRKGIPFMLVLAGLPTPFSKTCGD